MEKGILLFSLKSAQMAEFKRQIEAENKGRDLLISMDPQEIEPHLDRIEIAMGDVPRDLIQRMGNLKWLQLWSAGADLLQRFPALREHPVTITTASGIHVQQMAEHLFAMLLGWNRQLPATFEARQKRHWLKVQAKQLAVLNGKKMLILGFGSIGESIAKIACAFGLEVTGLRRNVSQGTAINGIQLAEASKLHSLLPAADYVVNILPLTPETRHFFGSTEFSLMKNSALYINIGRGATSDEIALIEALRTKSITGALLDVCETEPLPENSPLWELDNVMITAHYAGAHPDYSSLAMEVALENLRRYNRGEELKNVVDKIKGY